MPSEHQFLHDLASPLAAALLMLDIVGDCLRDDKPAVEDTLTRLQKTTDVMLRIRDMINSRRAALRQEEKP